MDLEDEGAEIDDVFDQLSQAPSSASQRPSASSTPPVPQSNVGNRRHRREGAKGGKKMGVAVEPGFAPPANEPPVNIQRKKNLILGGLKDILANHKKALPSKKDAFTLTPLDSMDQVMDMLELNDNGELVKMSSMLYAMRVDTTYNDAVATNCQLQPNLVKTDDASKKSKADQKFQQTAATQSLNLQNLQHDMDQDAPDFPDQDFPDIDLPDMGDDLPMMMDDAPMENGHGGGEEEGMEGVGGDGGELGGMDDGVPGGGVGEEGSAVVSVAEGGEGGQEEHEQQEGMGGDGEEEVMEVEGGQPQERKEESEDEGVWYLDSEDEAEDKKKREAEMSDEQLLKIRDQKPMDTVRTKYSDTVIEELVSNEIKRRERNLDRKCDLNPMLMDGDKQARIFPSDILTNEYYQIATSHYKDLNASGMLTYNAKVTHNGRMTLMHKTMDNWKDVHANDTTRPTVEFRQAIAGLVDNAMEKYPVYVNAFDKKDQPGDKNVLTSGLELMELEKKTRDKILTDTGDFDFLDRDDQIEDEDDQPRPPSRKGSVFNGEEGRESSRSFNPSTPAAETENSDGSSTTPKKDDEMDKEAQSQNENAAFMEDIAGMDKRLNRRNLSLLAAFQHDDTLPGAPVLSTDDLASDFQLILFDKISQGSKCEWKTGSHCEELQAPKELIEEETEGMQDKSADNDMSNLDKIWTCKFYKRNFTAEEVKTIKAKLKEKMPGRDHDAMSLQFKPGEHEFLGHDDKWTNPAITTDEINPIFENDETLVRELEDEREKKIHQRVIAVEEGEEFDEEDEAGEFPTGDERINVEPANASTYHDDFNDMGDNGFMSDEEIPTSRRSDFTGGDDQREGEASEISGVTPMLDDNAPSAAVRTTGKADDSHWKGGKQEVVKPKKEKKKKLRDDDEHRLAHFFDCSDTSTMLDSMNKKCKNRFAQTSKNFDLMKESDQLFMPVQVDIVPQQNYNIKSYYSPFLLPEVIHDRYVIRGSESDDGESANARLGHYTSLLDASMSDETDGEDVFLSFLKTFKHFPEVATQKEIELENRVKSGEIQPDEAAIEMTNHVDADMGGMGGMGGFDDHDDFGGGGDDRGFDDDFGGDDRQSVPSQSRQSSIPPQAIFVHNQEKREKSQTRSIAASSTRGFGMRVGMTADGNDDEGDAVATMGNREYELRLIKLDTVAMKTALSDVLTNPLMTTDKLDVTLAHFHRAFPSQKADGQFKKRKKEKPLQTIDEDAEFEPEVIDIPDDSRDDSQFSIPNSDIEATMMEVPDALNVTRALFAPPKEKAKAKTFVFGDQADGPSTSQEQANNSMEHIALIGHHTLKSTFTCLPARMPVNATSDVTVASTIAMILHLANENNLILNQDGQEVTDINEEANTSATFANWMTDFEVRVEDDDEKGTKINHVRKSLTKGVEVLAQLSADEDPSDAVRRQKETDKVLEDTAARQRAEKEAEERRRTVVNGGAAKRRDQPGSSSDVVDISSGGGTTDDDEDAIIDVITVPKNGFKKPSADGPSSSRRGTLRSMGDDDESAPGPSTKRARRTSGGANMEDTIVLDD